MRIRRMTGPEHYREAEWLLAEAMQGKANPRTNWYSPEYTNTLAAAQVHATLAHAAAVAWAAVPAYQTVSVVDSIAGQWDSIVEGKR
jgi:hypothetical protein